jgi:putative ABC transport system permease protein
MNLKRRFARVVALFGSSRIDRELDDEVLAHLELAERDAIARGLDPIEARREARRQFGGVEQMKEAHRDDRSAMWIDHLIKDARYGLASLRREPVFAVTAIAVLALGIGANAAMFSVVDGALLKPLPFPNPERVVRMWEAPSPTSVNSTTAHNYVELKRRLRTFAAFSAEADINATADLNGDPARLAGRVVSADHFEVFGISPLIGRTFRADEDQPGNNHVIVLSHAAWQQRFGGDSAILSRDVRLDGTLHRVIGVMPPGVFDRDRRRARMEVVSFWKPLGLTPAQLAASSHWLNPVGRLRPGVSVSDAQRDMLDARAAIADQIPPWKRDWSVKVEPFDAALVDDRLRQSLYIALGSVVLVLLIACASLTNLLLSRGATRHKEIAVRVALGASRARVVSQLMTESLVLGVLGGLAGVALASVLIRAAIPLLPVELPFTADISLNVRVLGFAALLALVVAAIVGALPAIRISAGPAVAALNSAARGSTGQHDGLRRLIVAGEVAVSIVLICGSVLLFKSLLRLQNVDIGATLPNILTASIDIARDAYPTPDHAIGFYTSLIERVKQIPGVEDAALAGDVPLEGTGGEGLRVAGRSTAPMLVRFKRAGTGYFETLGIPLTSGRTFSNTDRLGSPWVTVINQALADRLKSTFGMHQPIGQVVDLPAIEYGTWTTTRQPMTIVGIVHNERVQGDLRAEPLGIAYVPLAQAPILWSKIAVRTRDNPIAVVPSLREALRTTDSRVALAQVRTLNDLRALSLSGLQEPAWLLSAFALLSVMLAALGLYGVVSHAVTQQRREIGIRMALGARSNDVLSMVVRHALQPIGIGLGVGVASAVGVTRVTESLLFQVSALDPSAFAIAAASMLSVGLVAALIPARRATRVDPTTALRSE